MTTGPPPSLASFHWDQHQPYPQPTNPSPSEPNPPSPDRDQPEQQQPQGPQDASRATRSPSLSVSPDPAGAKIHVRLPYDFLTSPSHPEHHASSAGSSRRASKPARTAPVKHRPDAAASSWEPVVEWSPPPHAGLPDGALVRSPRVRMSASKPTAPTSTGASASASSTSAATTAAAAAATNAAASAATASTPFPSEHSSQVESAPIMKAGMHSPSDRPDAAAALPSEYAMSLPPPAVLATGRKASVSLHLFAGSASSKQQHGTKDKSLKSQGQLSSLSQSQQLSAARSPAAAPALTRSPTAPTPSTISKRHASTGDRSPLHPSASPATPLDLLGQINPELVSITRSASTEKHKTRTGSASTPALPQQKAGSPPPLSIAPALPTSSSSTATSNRDVPPQADLVVTSHVPIPEEAVSMSDTEESSFNSSDSDSFSTANGDEQDDEQDPSQPRAQSISIPSPPTSIRRVGEGSSLSRSRIERTTGSASVPLSDQSGSGEEDDEHSELPTVIQLQPFYNQVGGHSSIFQFSSHAVCKPLVSRENQFYESLELNGRQLLRFVPRYLGVLNVSFRPVYPEDIKPPSDEQLGPAQASSPTNPSSSPQAPTSTRSPATQPGTPCLPPKRKIFKGQNMDDVEVPEVAVELNRHLMPEWVLGEEEGTHSPHPTLWALEHPRPHHQRAQHGPSPPTHPSHLWSSSNVGSSTRRSYDSGAMSDSDTRQRRPRSPYSSSPQSLNTTTRSTRANRSLAGSEGKVRHGSVPHTSLRAPLGLTSSTQAASSTPGSYPRPTTPNTPSTSTHPPGSRTCVFGRGSTAVNQRLQAQVLREVFSASNLRDTAAATRRRTRSSRAGSSQSRRSHSSTRHEVRARSSERTGASYEGGRNPTPPHRHSHTPTLSSTRVPHPMTPASHSEGQSGQPAPTSSGSSSVLRDPLQMPQSHPARSPQSVPSPPSRPTSLRTGAAMVQVQQKDSSVDESLDPGASTSRGHEELFEMDDWHDPEGMPTPPVSNPDLTGPSHRASSPVVEPTPVTPAAEHAQDPEVEGRKGKDSATHSSWLNAGGHENLLRSGYFLLMEDLTGRLHAPCVLDLKMGTRQYSLDATDAKRASQSSKAAATTSRTHGARICGMQVYHCSSLSYTFQDKYFGRKIRPNEFESALGNFLHNGQTLLLHHVPGIVAQLRQLARIVHQLPGYRFYASSLLFIYDGDCATQQRLMAHFERRAKEGRAGVPPAWAVAGPNNGHPTRSASTGKGHHHHHHPLHHHHHHHHTKPHRGEMKIRIIDFAHSTTGRDYRFPGEEFVSPLANQSDHGEHDQDPWWHQADLYADKEELYEEQEAKEEEAFAEWLSRPIVRFAPSHPEGPDSGYLWGLKNLTAAFEGIWETERHARVLRARQEAVAQLDPSLLPPNATRRRRSAGESLTGHAKWIVDRAGKQADLGPLQASDPGVFDEIFGPSDSEATASEDPEKGYVSDKDTLDYMAATNQSNPNSTSTSTPGRSTATVTPAVASPIGAVGPSTSVDQRSSGQVE